MKHSKQLQCFTPGAIKYTLPKQIKSSIYDWYRQWHDTIFADRFVRARILRSHHPRRWDFIEHLSSIVSFPPTAIYISPSRSHPWFSMKRNGRRYFIWYIRPLFGVLLLRVKIILFRGNIVGVPRSLLVRVYFWNYYIQVAFGALLW